MGVSLCHYIGNETHLVDLQRGCARSEKWYTFPFLDSIIAFVSFPFFPPHTSSCRMLIRFPYQDHDRHHHYLGVPISTAVVTRECWDCGRVCAPCASRSARICKRCKTSYCVWHNTGCDDVTCDWCQFRGGNTRLREMY